MVFYLFRHVKGCWRAETDVDAWRLMAEACQTAGLMDLWAEDQCLHVPAETSTTDAVRIWEIGDPPTGTLGFDEHGPGRD